MNEVDSVLVGYSNVSGDNPVLIVGRKNGKKVDIINAFQGNEAVELYEKLTTVNSKK